MKRKNIVLHTLTVKKPTLKQKYRGLCINCDNRATCTFPRQNGGVLFCDEYK